MDNNNACKLKNDYASPHQNTGFFLILATIRSFYMNISYLYLFISYFMLIFVFISLFRPRPL